MLTDFHRTFLFSLAFHRVYSTTFYTTFLLSLSLTAGLGAPSAFPRRRERGGHGASMKSDEPDRVAPSTAPAAATAERERPLPGEIPLVMAAAETASRDDHADEPEESQLMFGPAGLTDEEVPLFTGAARLVSVGSAAHFNEPKTSLSSPQSLRSPPVG